MKDFLKKYKFIVLYFLLVLIIFFGKEMEFKGMSMVCNSCWILDLNLCYNFIGHNCYSYERFYLPLPIYWVGYFPHYKGLVSKNIIIDLLIPIFLFLLFYIKQKNKNQKK